MRERMRALRKRIASSWTAGVPPALTQDAGGMPAVHKIVAGYVAHGSEADPKPLISALDAQGWTPALPRAIDRASPLSFHAEGPLTPDAFGIPAPSATAPRLTPDLLIVPLLAFDRSGGRLGQGAGCYDRTIAALRARGPVRVVGLAYGAQEVDRVPMGEHDQRLDGILTDNGFIAVVGSQP